MSSPSPTFGRSAPTDRRASIRCVRASSTAVSSSRRRAGGSSRASRCAACSCIRIAAKPCARLSWMSRASRLRSSRIALRRSSRRFARPAGCGAAPAPPAARSPRSARRATSCVSQLASAAGCDSVIHPSVAAAEHQRRATIVAASHCAALNARIALGQPRIVRRVLDRLVQPACTRRDGRAMLSQRELLPGSLLAGSRDCRRREQAILDVGHPQVAALPLSSISHTAAARGSRSPRPSSS